MSFQYGLNDIRRRRTRDKGKDDHFTSVAFDHVSSHHVLPGPVSSFHENMGPKEGDEFQRCGLIEDGHIIYTSKTGEDLRSFLKGENGPKRAFESPDGKVAVDPDDQYVAEGSGCFEITDVASVEQVEAPVGEDDPFPFLFEAFNNPSEIFSSLDLLLHLVKTYQI
jgi:hypothetical protein